MSFAALALRARAANDTTRAQINNIPSKSHFIVLLSNVSCDQNQMSFMLTFRAQEHGGNKDITKKVIFYNTTLSSLIVC